MLSLKIAVAVRPSPPGQTIKATLVAVESHTHRLLLCGLGTAPNPADSTVEVVRFSTAIADAAVVDYFNEMADARAVLAAESFRVTDVHSAATESCIAEVADAASAQVAVY